MVVWNSILFSILVSWWSSGGWTHQLLIIWTTFPGSSPTFRPFKSLNRVCHGGRGTEEAIVQHWNKKTRPDQPWPDDIGHSHGFTIMNHSMDDFFKGNSTRNQWFFVLEIIGYRGFLETFPSSDSGNHQPRGWLWLIIGLRGNSCETYHLVMTNIAMENPS